jgi:site-specific DNA recombinase
MNQETRVASYARVSSQKQADEATIESQRQAVLNRIQRDQFELPKELEFCDDGFSGSQLLRPALEQLRDQINLGLVDRLYVLSPDRLARNFAHQAILLDEFEKRQCKVIFLSQEGLPASPEANLLIQMQGMIAEYEREKILERTRRGRRHAATAGKVSVFGGAPFGYRYIGKQEGGGEASWEIDPQNSEVVKLIFDLVGNERQTLGAVCRELQRRRIRTPSGKQRWARATVTGILQNPAYYGQAKFGRERLTPRKPGRRAKRGDPAIPRRAKVTVATKPEDQITISVPAIIAEPLFNEVAKVMDENRKRQRARKKGSSYLLSGMLLCAQCDSAYCSRTQGGRQYYRCLGTDRHRLSKAGSDSIKLCNNPSVKGPELEAQVWAELCKVLSQPERLVDELQRQREASPEAESKVDKQRQRVRQLRDRLDRLIDAYESGMLLKSEFQTRVGPLRQQHDRETFALANFSEDDRPTAEAIESLESITEKVGARLQDADFELKRTLLQLLIKRIEIDTSEIRIIYKVPLRPFRQSPASVRGELHHCTLRHVVTS